MSMQEIKARFNSIIWSKGDDYICSYQANDKKEILGHEARGLFFSAKGKRLPVIQNLDFILIGDWQKNNKGYPDTFVVKSTKEIIPTNKAGVIAYCSAIKGLGKRAAEKIFSRFGKSSIDVIKTNPKLLKSAGLTPKQILAIEEFNSSEEKVFAELYEFLGSHQISSKQTKAAVKMYTNDGKIALTEEEIIAAIKSNPYHLCNIRGIVFSHVDEIGVDNGLAKSIHRVASAANSALYKNEIDGNTMMSPKDLTEVLLKKLNKTEDFDLITRKEVRLALSELANSKKIILSEGYVYRTVMFASERYAAAKIVKMIFTEHKNTPKDKSCDALIKKAERLMGTKLAAEQLMAVKKALQENVLVITGGPGTGKTTIIKAIIEAYKEWFGNTDYALLAPTGRAARRLEESCGEPASTIHKYLGLMVGDAEGSEVPKENKVNGGMSPSMMILDESSMVDQDLLGKLMKFARPDSKIIFIGDVDQLPSVGAGRVLSDMIDSNTVPVVRLTKVYRQGDDSKIITNARSINDGKTDLNYCDEFSIIETKNAKETQDAVVKIFKEELENAPIEEITVLTPVRRKGEVSVNELNPLLQAEYNPLKHYSESPYVTSAGLSYHKGDKVMQLRNTKTVSNGDVGFISAVSSEGSNELELQINFSEIPESYGKSDYEHIDLAYATTVHKSQGSEYQTVIIPVCKENEFMLYKNLIYTAVTRAKKKVIIVGDKPSLMAAIRRKDQTVRKTMLKERLSANFNAKKGA